MTDPDEITKALSEGEGFWIYTKDLGAGVYGFDEPGVG
jgi:hypothetical protein